MPEWGQDPPMDRSRWSRRAALSRVRRLLLCALGLFTLACPPDASSSSAGGEQTSSEQNRKAGSGDERRIQKQAGDEHSLSEPEGEAQGSELQRRSGAEPGGAH